ncbi:ABC transporter substrate-binding protein [Modestobacter sp. I12A-02662]|uniref:ABC transporter substrate-binding protein n=1 Tax=Modestobacter sp. I12A-02662 TaxID=1730496 RepID=UPI0034DE3A53
MAPSSGSIPPPSGHGRGLSRRRFLAAASLGTLALTGCGTGFSLARGEGTGSVEGRLSFSLWAGDAELTVFQELADAWTRSSGVPVALNVVPFGELLTGVDAQLAGDRAPDLFRVTYQDIGLYAAGGALLDVTDRLPREVTQGFTDAFRQAVSQDGRLYGVPHHTDTSLVLYDVEAVQAAGLDPPTTLDEAWTWEEFTDAARRLPTRADQFPFAVNWQQAGAYRWLNWVAQNGGRLLDDDLTGPAVDSRAVREALVLTQGFFTEGLVPPTTSTKGSYADELFTTQTIGMVFAGDFLLPTIEPTLAEQGRQYGATFLPRAESAAADLGGNAVVATATSVNPEAAADFLAFLAGDEAQARFCEQAVVLPTRTALIERGLEYALRPDLMELYVEQATTISQDLVEQVTVPQFNAVNTSLVERLESAFLGNADAGEVLDGLADDIEGRLS